MKQNETSKSKSGSESHKFLPSKLPNLKVWSKTGVYYAVIKAESRRKVRSLRTKDYATAARRLPEAVSSLRTLAGYLSDGGEIEIFRDVLQSFAQKEQIHIRQSSVKYYAQNAKAILETAPARVLSKPISEITTPDLRAWQKAHAKKYSASRVNGSMSFLNKHVFAPAIENGQIGVNPLEKVPRLRVLQKNRWIPTPAEFARLVAEIRGNSFRLNEKGRCTGSAYREVTADAVELFAYTGMRLSEAQNLTWSAVRENHIEIRVGDDFQTKNGQGRAIPMNSSLRELLGRLREAPRPNGPSAPVMGVKRPTIALANACKRLGFPHLRTHDLRHLFATRCIEAGVDMPTVAKWMGHKDGGITCARVYAHVSPSHSDKQAEKVAF